MLMPRCLCASARMRVLARMPRIRFVDFLPCRACLRHAAGHMRHGLLLLRYVTMRYLYLYATTLPR